jgi:hypothetical protein
VDAAFMQLQVHGCGIHAVTTGRRARATSPSLITGIVTDLDVLRRLRDHLTS